MSRYLIKMTYLEGRHKGATYFLKKGGYVVGNQKYFLYSDTYNDERTVKSVCTKMRKNNELNREIERKDNDCRIAKGMEGKKYFMYNRCSYEPYELSDDMRVR